MAHARRKFFDLQMSSKSQIATQACAHISQLYEVERELKHLDAEERLKVRQAKSKPLDDVLLQWMLLAFMPWPLAMAAMEAAGCWQAATSSALN